MIMSFQFIALIAANGIAAIAAVVSSPTPSIRVSACCTISAAQEVASQIG